MKKGMRCRCLRRNGKRCKAWGQEHVIANTPLLRSIEWEDPEFQPIGQVVFFCALHWRMFRDEFPDDVLPNGARIIS